MAGQRNKNAFKFLLQLLIPAQKHILGVKKVVLDGLEVVWRWFGVVWVFPRTLTGRIISQKISPFEVNLSFIG